MNDLCEQCATIMVPSLQLVPISRKQIPHIRGKSYSWKESCFFKLEGTRQPTLGELEDLLYSETGEPAKILIVSRINLIYIPDYDEHFSKAISIEFVEENATYCFRIGSTNTHVGDGLTFLTSLVTRESSIHSIEIAGETFRGLTMLDWDEWHLARTLLFHNITTFELSHVELSVENCRVIAGVNTLRLCEVELDDDGDELVDAILEKQACATLFLEGQHGIDRTSLQRLFCSLSTTVSGTLSSVREMHLKYCDLDYKTCTLLNRIPLELLHLRARIDQVSWGGLTENRNETRIKTMSVRLSDPYGETVKEEFGERLSSENIKGGFDTLRNYPSLKRLHIPRCCVKHEESVPPELANVLRADMATKLTHVCLPCPEWTHLECLTDALAHHRTVTHVTFDEPFFRGSSETVIDAFVKLLKQNRRIVELRSMLGIDVVKERWQVVDKQLDENRLYQAQQAFIYDPKLLAETFWSLRGRRNVIFRFLQKHLARILLWNRKRKRKRVVE